MKKIKRTTFFIAALMLFVTVVLSTGCDLFNKYPAEAGSPVKVDDSLHVMENMEYHKWGEVFTLRTDGTYELVQYYNTSTTEPAKPNWGISGTYTYDPETFVLSRTVTSEYDDGTESWVAVGDNETKSISQKLYFTEHSYGMIYTKTDNSWVNVDTWSGQEDLNDPETAWRYTTTYTYTISAGSGGFQYSRVSVSSDLGSNEDTTVTIETRAGDAEMFPAGITFEKGNNVTVRANITADTSQYYNYTAEEMGDVIRNTLQVMTYTFSVIEDDQMIETPNIAARTME